MSGDDDGLRYERRRIIRQARLYTWGFAAAAVAVALAGGALLAWLLTGLDLPFVPTWLAVSAALVVIPALAHVVQAVRSRAGTGTPNERS